MYVQLHFLALDWQLHKICNFSGMAWWAAIGEREESRGAHVKAPCRVLYIPAFTNVIWLCVNNVGMVVDFAPSTICLKSRDVQSKFNELSLSKFSSFLLYY